MSTPSPVIPKRPDLSRIELLPHQQESIEIPDGDFWVFAYGSLMWNPGFRVAQSQPATLFGYHRRLCLWSVEYRGTPKEPGLVLGLTSGGCCPGMAFLVAHDAKQEAGRYLAERELNTDAYHVVRKNIRLADQQTVNAVTFVAKTDHPQYAGLLDFSTQLAVVASASGQRGDNKSYLCNTVSALEHCGINRSPLHRLRDALPTN